MAKLKVIKDKTVEKKKESKLVGKSESKFKPSKQPKNAKAVEYKTKISKLGEDQMKPTKKIGKEKNKTAPTAGKPKIDNTKLQSKEKNKTPPTVEKPEIDNTNLQSKILKRKKRREAMKVTKKRINELREKLMKGDAEAKKIIKELQSIVKENKRVSVLRVSVGNAEKLLYFHKNGKFPKKEVNTEKKVVNGKDKNAGKKIAKGNDKNAGKKEAVGKEKNMKKEVVNGKTKDNKSAMGEEVTKKKGKNALKKLRRKMEKSDSTTEFKKVDKTKGEAKIDESSDDDYDVEENVIVDKIATKMNAKNVEEDESSEEFDETMEGVEEECDDEEEDSDDGEEEDSDDEEEGDSDEEEVEASKPKFKKINVKENLKKDGIIQKGQSRYVLFVGNIPFDCTTDEIKNHFSNTCSVKDVRIPLEQGSNKPRGFAYVELNDENSYQKALSLHHSQFKNRMINVLYSQGGKKKGEQTKQKMKAKNFKLQALRQKGVLTSDVKESRRKAARKAIRQKKNLKQKE